MDMVFWSARLCGCCYSVKFIMVTYTMNCVHLAGWLCRMMQQQRLVSAQWHAGNFLGEL